ncbi:MAG: hypothetical protein JSS02_08660 [Planctomycetes bacterium]|nr:hypothetical protein [Planctomycetota bacterium]
MSTSGIFRTLCVCCLVLGGSRSPAVWAQGPQSEKVEAKAADDKPAAGPQAEEPAHPAAGDVETGLPEGFVPAQVKDTAPEDIKEFFATSDKVRLAAIKAHWAQFEKLKAKGKAAGTRRGYQPGKEGFQEELALAAETAAGEAATQLMAIKSLMHDVGYVVPFEAVPPAGEERILKPGLVLRLGHPIRVVRVVDANQMVILVDEQHKEPKRVNSSGKTIEPIRLKRVQAVLLAKTAGVKAGAKVPVKETLRVTGSQTVGDTELPVLEIFSLSEFLKTPDSEE